MKISPRKKIIFASVATLVLCSVVFLILEIYLRIAKDYVDLDQFTGKKPGVSNPNKQWAFIDAFCAFSPQPGQRYTFGKLTNKTVNDHGFFSTPPISAKKPQGTIRILFLGGSSTAGTGHNLQDTDTWPWQTIDLLRKRLPTKKIDFINGSCAGYSTFESYGRLWSRLRHFSPDIVVMNHAWNEMQYFAQAENIHQWRVLKNSSWKFQDIHKVVKLYEPHWVDHFVKYSQLLIRIRFQFSTLINGEIGQVAEQELQTDFNHKGLSILQTNFKLIRETCSVIDAKLFVAKQATLISTNTLPQHRTKCRCEYHGFNYDAHIRAFEAIYNTIDKEFAAKSVIDLTSLSGQPDYFFDHVHPTPLGCKKIAEIVAEKLVWYIKNK
ncbi:SGNH/GDSL hydrolase family protein [Candidatus Uabimicrobium amorphum]|nr:SGNH/GDSL hydrolase family protein [Candidatus Uabimicrobium amorphum]